VNTDIPKAQRAKIITNILSNIPGRVWEGKEIILDALAAHCEAYKRDTDFESDEQRVLLQKVLDLSLKECSRNNLMFKLRALVCLKKILKVPLFEKLVNNEFYEQARKSLLEVYSEEQVGEQLTDEERQKQELELKQKQKQLEEVRCQVLELVPLIVPEGSVELFRVEKDFILDKLKSARISIPESNALLSAAQSLVGRLVANKTVQEQLLTSDQLLELFSVLCQQLDPNQRQLVVRNRAIEHISDIVKTLKVETPNLLVEQSSAIQSLLSEAKNKEKDATVMLKISALLNGL